MYCANTPKNHITGYWHCTSSGFCHYLSHFRSFKAKTGGSKKACRFLPWKEMRRGCVKGSDIHPTSDLSSDGYKLHSHKYNTNSLEGFFCLRIWFETRSKRWCCLLRNFYPLNRGGRWASSKVLNISISGRISSEAAISGNKCDGILFDICSCCWFLAGGR